MLSDAVPLHQCSRALVIKLRHLGDVLLSTPVLSVLKAHAPGLEVDALVYDDTVPMLEGHPAVSQIHFVGRKWRQNGPFERLRHELKLFQALRARCYELIVHLTEQPRGAWLARALKVRYSVAPAVGDRGVVWQKSFTHLYPMVPRRHTIEMNLDALRRIGIQPSLSDRKLVFVPGRPADEKAASLVPGGDFILMHPGSRWRFKRWTAEKNGELIDRLSGDGHRIVICSAPDSEEIEFSREILSRSKAGALHLTDLSIKEMGALVARARLFIGVDSMPMHVAAAMGTPTVALFGPSGENVWGPRDIERRIVTTAHTCRPCGFDGCGGGKVSECLTLLPVDAVYAAARELLAKSAVQ